MANSHLLFTPPVHTSYSHLLFTPAGRKRPNVSFKSIGSGAPWCPRRIHTLWFTPPIHTSYSHPQAARGQALHPSGSPLAHRDVQFTPPIYSLLFTHPVHTSYAHLPSTPSYSHLLFTPPVHTSYSHPQAARGQALYPSRSALAHRDAQFTPSYSHLLFTPPVHTSYSHLQAARGQALYPSRSALAHRDVQFTASYSHLPVTPSYPHLSFTSIHTRRPQEAKRFIQVDRLWRTVMSKTVSKPNVLLATAQEGLLTSWREANAKLELIQKGLNDYLEAKRCVLEETWKILSLSIYICIHVYVYVYVYIYIYIYVTAKERLLTSWREANAKPELIQKGLNDYLEAKRCVLSLCVCYLFCFCYKKNENKAERSRRRRKYS